MEVNRSGALGLNMEVNSTKLTFFRIVVKYHIEQHINSPLFPVCVYHNDARCVRTIIDCKPLGETHFCSRILPSNHCDNLKY